MQVVDAGASCSTALFDDRGADGLLNGKTLRSRSREAGSLQSVETRSGRSTGSSAGSFATDGEGHFRFPIPLWQLNVAEEIVREVRDGADLSDALRGMGQLRALPGYTIQSRKLSGAMTPHEGTGRDATDGYFSNQQKVSDIVMFYLHFELDDIMLLAQMWQLKKERGELQTDPIIVWAVSYTDLVQESLFFEKKQLMASLLGVQTDDVFMLLQPTAGDVDSSACQGHPMTEELRSRREETISNICEMLLQYPSALVHLYISAPCNGNIGAIRDYLREGGSWPPKGKWKIRMYTGSYNIRGDGMHEADIEAVKDLVSDANPIVDISRYVFFGGEASHPSTRGLGSFSLPSLAKEICRRDGWLAAAIRTFHDEFNRSLISPSNDRLFFEPLTDEEKAAFDVIAYELDATGDFKGYAQSLYMDADLMAKVPDHKKSCVAAFKNDACEAPLCGQLLFAYEWLAKEKPNSLTQMQVGRWLLDTGVGKTSVDTSDPGGVRAIQPALAVPNDMDLLRRLRRLTQAFFLRYLDRVTREEPMHEDGEASQEATERSPKNGEAVPMMGFEFHDGASRLAVARQRKAAMLPDGALFQKPLSWSSGSPETRKPSNGRNRSPKRLQDGADASSIIMARPSSLQDPDNASNDAAASDDDEQLSAWKSVAERAHMTIDPGGADTYDVVIPKIRGVPLYLTEVRDLGNKLALRGKRLTNSSCSGPVLPLAISLRVVQVLAGAGMALQAYLTSTCEQGLLKYDYWIWGPYFVFILFHLSMEIRIFRHLSLPYIQSVGRWELLTKEVTFEFWFTWQMWNSLLHLFGIGTANSFLGMVSAEHLRQICGPEAKMGRLWKAALDQSILVHWASDVPFCVLPLIVFGVQFLHLLCDVIYTLPGWNQWNTKGINWRYGKPFPQELEWEVVEYVSPQVGGVSLLGLRRPLGTRFVYYNVIRRLLTTGAALDHICMGSGMSTIQSMDNYIDPVARDTKDVVPKKFEIVSCDAADKALIGTRKFLQDGLSVINRRLLMFLFSGLLFSGCHLQLQLSYHYLQCTAYPSHCHYNSTRLWVGIATATLSSSIMLFKIVMAFKVGLDVLTIWHCCKNFVIPAAEELIQNGSHDHPEKCVSTIRECVELHSELKPRLVILLFLSLLLVMLFGMALAKMTMGQFVCEHHVWNFRLNLWSGCVSFTE